MITNPLSLVKQFLFIGAILGGGFLIYQLYIRKRLGKKHVAYKRAVKQSRKKHKQPIKNQSPKISMSRPIDKSKGRSKVARKNKDHNLTVIEGKKGKKKNRAFF